jgi:hypothetical protein
VENDLILSTLQLYPSIPKFVFAHLAQVHDAIYDENGNFSQTRGPYYHNADSARHYISSIRRMNVLLLELLERIREEDSQAIIIVQADHGPSRSTEGKYFDNPDAVKNKALFLPKTAEDFDYMFGILSAIYIPPTSGDDLLKKYFSEEFSLVNTFLAVFSHLSGRNFKPLENKRYALEETDKGLCVHREK